jgi:hypothetical protein
MTMAKKRPPPKSQDTTEALRKSPIPAIVWRVSSVFHTPPIKRLRQGA